MLKIRLQRTGRINLPSYRLIVAEHTEGPKTGKFVDKVGTYDPRTKERIIDTDRIKHWMSVGAKPSATVHNMLVSMGVLNAKKINVLPAYKEPVKEEAPAEAVPAAESAVEAPAETVADVSSEALAKEEEAPAETPADEPKEEEAPAGSTGSPQAGEVAPEEKAA